MHYSRQSINATIKWGAPFFTNIYAATFWICIFLLFSLHAPKPANPTLKKPLYVETEKDITRQSQRIRRHPHHFHLVLLIEHEDIFLFKSRSMCQRTKMRTCVFYQRSMQTAGEIIACQDILS